MPFDARALVIMHWKALIDAADGYLEREAVAAKAVHLYCECESGPGKATPETQEES